MKLVTSDEAATLIRDGWTVATTGFGGIGHPEAVTAAIERRFQADQHPRDLTLLFGASQGDRATRGIGHLAHRGLVKRVIAGGWRGAPRLGALAAANEILAHNWPQGTICQLFRAIAGGRPGIVTPIGLHTFVDPRRDGGRLNTATTEQLIEVVTLGGREYLFYPARPIDCAIVRGTTADADGNITAEHEAFHQDMLAIAQAARNSGGIVIAQVKRLAERGALNPNLVRVPGILVDHVVVAKPEEHWLSFGEEHNPAYTGEIREPKAARAPLPLDVRKVIQRRAFLEMMRSKHDVINLGIGIPAGIGKIADEEGVSDFTMTVEAGPIGGIPAEEFSFGAATNPVAILDQASMFDFYDGGGLDISFLGMAELDVHGNVNVSRIGKTIFGVGGFINISQTAKRLVFMGTLTTSGLEVAIADGRLSIVNEGKIRKIVTQVDHLSFNGPYVAGRGIEILYLTERAVFALRDARLTLIEVAPGIDPRDVLALCPDGVAAADQVATMDARIFRDAPMGMAR